MEFLAEGAVAIEVYGHKQANHRRNLALWDLGVIQAKTRSLRERCSGANAHNHAVIKTDSKSTQNTHKGLVRLARCRRSKLCVVFSKM